MDFRPEFPFTPKGHQPKAIEKLTRGLEQNWEYQTLLGVTGSGKTFTIANVINNVNRPTLVISHNKTLAAQLYSEFKSLFPENAVEYFVSYYDYYQPESYVPARDLYIEKDASINEKIDRLRQRAINALMTRRDAIIVASVSCIYGLGSPREYEKATFKVKRTQEIKQDHLLKKLVDLHYDRNDMALSLGTFRVRGDLVEICGAQDHVTRIEFFGDTIDRITEVDPLTGNRVEEREETLIFPAEPYMVAEDKVKTALQEIRKDLQEQISYFKEQEKMLEAHRIEQRTKYDLEMIEEFGHCKGIENYSRYFDGRAPGEPPHTLLDFFPDDFLTVIDESHRTVPQIKGMYRGDRSRKETLVEHGFRLPSALDNRPLRFEEFKGKVKQIIFMSATPAEYERTISDQIVEQIVRPTGLVDPIVEVRPTKHQVDDLINEIRKRTAREERTLVTTLTKRMAEDLSEYLREMGIKSHYLHGDHDTIERTHFLEKLRKGTYDAIVGINLLREGLDLPEVSLVAILDADKEGFLRSRKSLIQIGGRAARNTAGKIILYADKQTTAMKKAIEEMDRRREIQVEYNRKHDIQPKTIEKEIKPMLIYPEEVSDEVDVDHVSPSELRAEIEGLKEEMWKAAEELEFTKAQRYKERIEDLHEALRKKTPA